jgi:hypothetical protein
MQYIAANEFSSSLISYSFWWLAAATRSARHRALAEILAVLREAGVKVWPESKKVFRGGTMGSLFRWIKSKAQKAPDTCAWSLCNLRLTRLRCDAEDAPQTVVELEGRLRAVEVITRTYARRPRRSPEQRPCDSTRRDPAGLPSTRERIVANLGRVVDVRLLLPDVTVNLEHVVARVAI